MPEINDLSEKMPRAKFPAVCLPTSLRNTERGGARTQNNILQKQLSRLSKQRRELRVVRVRFSRLQKAGFASPIPLSRVSETVHSLLQHLIAPHVHLYA